MKNILLAALLVGFGLQANAEDATPAWSCQLSGEISGQSVGLGLNVVDISGNGIVKCESFNGVRTETPVRIKIGGMGVSLGYTKYSSIKVATAAVGVKTGPSEFVGSYSVGPSVGVTLVQAGIRAGLALNVSKQNLGFELGFISEESKGLEASLRIQVLSIEAM